MRAEVRDLAFGEVSGEIPFDLESGVVSDDFPSSTLRLFLDQDQLPLRDGLGVCLRQTCLRFELVIHFLKEKYSVMRDEAYKAVLKE